MIRLRRAMFDQLMVCFVSLILLQASYVPAQDAPKPAKDDSAASQRSSVDDDSNKAESNELREPPPFEVRPYSIRVDVALEHQALPSSTTEQAVLSQLSAALQRMYGVVWGTRITTTKWLAPATAAKLESIQPADVLERFPEQSAQKTFLVVMTRSGTKYTISVREYDARIQELTPVYSHSTRDVRSIAMVAARLMRDAFRPVVLFTRHVADEKTRPVMEFRVQAGALKVPDPSAEQVIEGDVLRAFTRQMDRRDPNKVSLLRTYPLSYVRVLRVLTETEAPTVPIAEGEPVDIEAALAEAAQDQPGTRQVRRGRLTGIYLTHLSGNLFGAKGRRLEHFALRQRPTADQSRVRVVLRGRPDRPLVSHRLSLAYQLYWQDEEDGPQTRLVTDRNGEVVIKNRDGHPTFWIRVYSGKSLLARVPYAPGLLPFDVVELPDDSVRLSVEGEINLIADELIDAIALREVLIARARVAAEAGDGDKVNELLGRYAEIPGQQEFLQRITNIRAPAIELAEKRGLGDSRIIRLCDGLKSTINRFFTDQQRAKRQKELRELTNAVN